MDGPEPTTPLGRRAFLGTVALGATSLLWGDKALQLVQGAADRLPAPMRAAVPVGDRWRIYAVDLPYPTFDPGTWRLTVDGLVDRPQSWSIDDLRGLGVVEQTSDFHCVTGWSVLGARWRGLPLRPLLERAGLQPGATAVRFGSAERPYVDTLTLEQVAQPDCLLALDLDGAPLRREMGAPARVVMPKMYGYKGVKWLARMTVTDRVEDGYWEQRGYDRDAWVDGEPG